MTELLTTEYTYHLPPERIALYPLKQRDHSKLLVSRNNGITHAHFSDLPEFLPSNSFLFFNNTKVIPARIRFQKDTGADIEIFLLDPVSPSTLVHEAMQTKGTCSWHCTIGNLKRWPPGLKLRKTCRDFVLEASLIDEEKKYVAFTWTASLPFAEVVAQAGETPLPPYLKRKPEDRDRNTYQTIYSKEDGAVAAPTAGLHFTESVFDQLKVKNIEKDFLTLHVSAGTFAPIKEGDANKHIMHREQIIVSRRNIENLLREDKFFIPVGTTSMRTMESIYWFGAKLMTDPATPFYIGQNEPYIISTHPDRRAALMAILNHMDNNGSETLSGETAIFIKPGYKFKVCNALITNFHQPGSTLLLLVAAFTGNHWKTIYKEALANDYRFLSYGDSSLLFQEQL